MGMIHSWKTKNSEVATTSPVNSTECCLGTTLSVEPARRPASRQDYDQLDLGPGVLETLRFNVSFVHPIIQESALMRITCLRRDKSQDEGAVVSR
jgi:hypothetical protein